jgi:uncharacterized protein YaiI (UPF0178 family)
MKRGVDAYASPIAIKKILFCTVERTQIVTMLVATSKLLRVLPPSLYIESL